MRILIIAIFLLSSFSCFSFDDHDIEGSIDAEGFKVGKDNNIGGYFYYIVDRTNGLCFAGNMHPNAGGVGLTSVPCDKLKKTPVIKKYIETGKVPK